MVGSSQIDLMAKLNIATFSVNGKDVSLEGVAADTPLLWFLRDHIELTGTRFGCGKGLCGACTVLLDGVPVRACLTLVGSIVGRKVKTIEGLSEKGDHPLQKAWQDLAVPQCGYCQSGQLMAAAALLEHNPKPTDEDIDAAMSGNICRCGTYTRIRAAIHSVAGANGAAGTNREEGR